VWSFVEIPHQTAPGFGVRLPHVAVIAERLDVAVVLCAAFSERDDVIPNRGEDVPS